MAGTSRGGPTFEALLCISIALSLLRGCSAKCVPGDSRWNRCTIYPLENYQSCDGDYGVELTTEYCWVSVIFPGGRMKCGCSNPYSSCENPSKNSECDDQGDVASTCVSLSWPQYRCECSTGYHDEGGVCVNTNACIDHGNRCRQGSPVADSSAMCRDLDPPLIGIACDCSAGFRDVGGVCNEQQCSPLILGPNVVATGGCQNGDSLRTISNPTCAVACEAGYHGNAESPAIVCPANSYDGSLPQTSFECFENECDIFSFFDVLGVDLAGIVEGDPSHNKACTDGLTLTAVNRPSCDLRCKPGYSQSAGIPRAVCNIDGGRATSDLVCDENRCNAFTYPEGIVGDLNSTRPCGPGANVTLSAVTNPSCYLACDVGFVAESGVALLECGIDGGETTTNLVCVPVEESFFADDEEMWLYAGGAGVGALVLFICVAVLICCCLRRKARKMQLRSGGQIMELQTIVKQKELDLESKLRDIELMSKAWIIAFDDVELLDKKPLASGAFGSVWRAEYRNWTVALKMMHHTHDKQLTDENEIRFLQRVNHPRVLKFIGAGKMEDENLFCLLEFCACGSLDRYIHKASEEGDDISFTWFERLGVMSDTVDGMRYLHESVDSIHRDLKSANVLLCREKGKLRAKVGDFGMSKLTASNAGLEDCVAIDVTTTTDEQGRRTSTNSTASSSLPTSSPSSSLHMTMTAGVGTPTHIAPEVWKTMTSHRSKLSKKMDVYSFGIILWETLELKKPWTFAQFSYQIAEWVENDVRPAVSRSRRHADENGHFPPSMYYRVLSEAWDGDVRNRPSFSVIQQRIRTWTPSARPAKMSWDRLFPKSISPLQIKQAKMETQGSSDSDGSESDGAVDALSARRCPMDSTVSFHQSNFGARVTDCWKQDTIRRTVSSGQGGRSGHCAVGAFAKKAPPPVVPRKPAKTKSKSLPPTVAPKPFSARRTTTTKTTRSTPKKGKKPAPAPKMKKKAPPPPTSKPKNVTATVKKKKKIPPAPAPKPKKVPTRKWKPKPMPKPCAPPKFSDTTRE